MTLSEKQKLWHLTHKSKKRESWRKWYAKNKEAHRKQARESYHRRRHASTEGGFVPTTGSPNPEV